MAKQKVLDMEKKRDRARRYAGYLCTLAGGKKIHAWVSADEFEIEFHGIDLKTVCRLAVERASEKNLAAGEVLVPRALLIEVEKQEHGGGR